MRSLPSVSPPVVLFRGLFAGLLLLAGGCRASDRHPAVTAPPSVAGPGELRHWPVPAPPPFQAAQPVLWVALAAHLGPAGAPDPAGSPPLRLRGAAGPLTLIDAAGRRFQGQELLLHWRRQALPGPLRWRRRVQGPFASFESADQAAARWRAQGVAVEIARPRDWEVWAPATARPPEGVASRLVERTETQRWLLELRRPGAAVLLASPLRLEAAAGLHWNSGVYAGPFRLQSDAHGGWSLVEQVPLERYLDGVVPHEIGASAPRAALEAQAVLARTWAVGNRHRFVVDGYHLCADTQCQVYSDPRQAGAAVRQAIAASRQKVLTAAGRPIHAVYHASNGGVAAGFDEVWSAEPVPYLRPAADGPPAFAERFSVPLAPAALTGLLADGRQAYGADHPVFRWQRLLTADQISRALAADARALGSLRSVKVLERGPSGRVLALEIRGNAGATLLRRDAIRRTLRGLPSTLFVVKTAGPGVWRFEGGGFGHGAGLSQAGAIDLAGRGWNSSRILQHYYPGTALQPLIELGDGL